MQSLTTTSARPGPSYVLWEVTLACNLRCKHCGARAGRRRADELSLEEAHSVCAALARIRTASVCLMGGELLLRRDWQRIAGRLRELDIDVGFITNGLRFDDAVARGATALGVCQVGTSLDGARAEVHDAIRGRAGAHARAQRAVRLIAQLDIPHKAVITSVNRANLDEVEPLRDWLAEHARGFTWIVNVSTCHEASRMPREQMLRTEEYRRLVRLIAQSRAALSGTVEVSATHDIGYFSSRYPDIAPYEWTGCAAGLQTVQIQSNGGIKGCLALDDAFVEGNVRTHDLARVWHDPDAFAYNRRFDAETDLRGECVGCPHGSVCRGGCGDVSYAYSGELHHHPFCLYRLEQKEQGPCTR